MSGDHLYVEGTLRGTVGPQIVVAVGRDCGVLGCICWVSRYRYNSSSATVISGPTVDVVRCKNTQL